MSRSEDETSALEFAPEFAPSPRRLVQLGLGLGPLLLGRGRALENRAGRRRDQVRGQDRYTFRELEVFTDRVRDALRLLPGVAKVDKYGVRPEAIFIETDLGNWAQLGLSTSQIQQLVADRNIVEVYVRSLRKKLDEET